MPRSIETTEDILQAMDKIPLLASVQLSERKEWLKGFTDKDNGKHSGSFVELLSYRPSETVLRENDWGGNDFLILVEGTLDVFMTNPTTGVKNKVNEIRPGESFGEMSLFAGVPRIATVVATGKLESRVLKIARQAARGMEKRAPKFIEQLSAIYGQRGLSTAIERIRQTNPDCITQAQLTRLHEISSFKVFGRSHVLCERNKPINNLLLINSGWVRRSNDFANADDSVGWSKIASEEFDIDFVGAGTLLGLEGLAASTPATWKYNATVMLRTEVIEINASSLRADAELCAAAQKAFAGLAVSDSKTDLAMPGDDAALASTEAVVTTGIVEAENVLVMDMDLCIRCGNCSLACEKVHGRTRLVRRGVHIERTPQSRPQAIQHLLVPEVCIHCQDPECLTGCPTGAIARLAHGQIDIEAETCTGCTACARLCPYNAISMVPEIPALEAQPNLVRRLGSWWGVAPPILPPAVTTTKKDENLIAVKCNLCEDTPLNPPGARKPAYSCEENCPTGALVRVNPREYFDEVNKRLDVVFQTPTMAVGRNIHRDDPVWTLFHIAGGLLIVMTLIGELAAWRLYGFDQRLGGLPLTLRWLTGIAGAVGIFGSMTYSWRRRIYRRRAGPLRYWLLVHVYLGAAGAVAIVLHGGGHGGGPLTTTLMVFFDLVMLTGLFGIVTYYASPRLLTKIEGDPILQEDLQARRKELRTELDGREKRDEAFEELLSSCERRFASFGNLLKQIRRRQELSALLASTRSEFRPEIESLTNDSDKENFVEQLEKLATLRRLDALIHLHRLMKVWLPPHIAAASIMVGLLLIHIAQVLFFATR